MICGTIQWYVSTLKKSYFALKWYNERMTERNYLWNKKRNILAYLGFQVVFGQQGNYGIFGNLIIRTQSVYFK